MMNSVPPTGELETPANIDAERCCLGLLLRNPDMFDDVTKLITAEDYFMTSHQYIYSAMEELYNRGGTISLVNVSEVIKAQGNWQYIGGEWDAGGYLSDLVDIENNNSTAKEYAQLIRSKSFLRKMLALSKHAEAQAYREGADGELVVREVENALQSLFGGVMETDMHKVPDIVDECLYVARTRQQMASMGYITGVETGFHIIDYLTLGFQPSNYIILAALPGVGKTALALQIADYVGMNSGSGVVFFSLEMSRKELVDRLIVYRAGLDAQRWKQGLLTDEEWERVELMRNNFRESKLKIHDNPTISIGEMWNKCRRLKQQQSLSLVVVDYVQLMSASLKNRSRNDEVSEISRGLKKMALELGVPVLVLSQLNRQVENRSEKRPTLADLRDSGSLGQDADVVMFVYKKDEVQTDNLIDIRNVTIAKHRSGPNAEFEMGFHKGHAMFVSIDDYHEPDRESDVSVPTGESYDYIPQEPGSPLGMFFGDDE